MPADQVDEGVGIITAHSDLQDALLLQRVAFLAQDGCVGCRDESLVEWDIVWSIWITVVVFGCFQANIDAHKLSFIAVGYSIR